MEDPFGLWQFTLNEDDDDEDEAYQPDENSNDDEDDDKFEVPNENLRDKSPFNLNQVLLRFNVTSHIAPNQLLIVPLPKKEDIPNSPFSVEQWDFLRHQCRIHFALLCRSLSFTTYCASSDAIITGLLALLHSFHIIFKSSVEMTSNLNTLFGEDLFVPVIGDPYNSFITRTDDIINNFRQEKTVDDLLEAQFFTDILKSLPTKGIDKPFYAGSHSPWIKEEDELLAVAHNRFENINDIQRYVMPGRSLQTIVQHSKKEWLQTEETTDTVSQPEESNPIVPAISPKPTDDSSEEDEDDDKPFIVEQDMKFEEGSLIEPAKFFP